MKLRHGVTALHPREVAVWPFLARCKSGTLLWKPWWHWCLFNGYKHFYCIKATGTVKRMCIFFPWRERKYISWLISVTLCKIASFHYYVGSISNFYFSRRWYVSEPCDIRVAEKWAKSGSYVVHAQIEMKYYKLPLSNNTHIVKSSSYWSIEWIKQISQKKWLH